MQNKILILFILLLSGYSPIAYAEKINVTDADTVWNLTLDNATNVSRLVGEPGVMVVKYADAISYQPLENAASVGRLVGEPGVMVVKYADAISYETFDNPTTTPPQSITNLSLQAAATTWLNFTWLNPHDLDYSHVMLYLNGSFLTNVSAPQNFYNITGLTPGTLYELGTHTVDTSSNINHTWVNNTAATLSTGEIKGDVNRNGRRDTGDATLILRYIVGLPIPSQYLPVLPIGDMNCNGRIDTGDATLILRDVVSLPIPRCWE